MKQNADIWQQTKLNIIKIQEIITNTNDFIV